MPAKDQDTQALPIITGTQFSKTTATVHTEATGSVVLLSESSLPS